jgi:hypothetical protein
VPEPELSLVLNSRLELVGFKVGNGMNRRGKRLRRSGVVDGAPAGSCSSTKAASARIERDSMVVRRVVGYVPHGHWTMTTQVAAPRHKGWTAPIVICTS